jgi:hypothetical protein
MVVGADGVYVKSTLPKGISGIDVIDRKRNQG